MAFVAGEIKSRPKFCRHGKCNTPRDWQFRQNFYGVVNEEISGQLFANIFAEWFQMGAAAYFEFKLHEIVSALQISSTISTWSWYAMPLHAFKINSWKFLYTRLPSWLNRKRSSTFGEKAKLPIFDSFATYKPECKIISRLLKPFEAVGPSCLKRCFTIIFFPNCLRGSVMIGFIWYKVSISFCQEYR